MRGLKLGGVVGTVELLQVASFTDAWIETQAQIDKLSGQIVASFTDAWIETGLGEGDDHYFESHLLQMRGLKHTSIIPYLILIRRIFYRCVD